MKGINTTKTLITKVNAAKGYVDSEMQDEKIPLTTMDEEYLESRAIKHKLFEKQHNGCHKLCRSPCVYIVYISVLQLGLDKTPD